MDLRSSELWTPGTYVVLSQICRQTLNEHKINLEYNQVYKNIIITFTMDQLQRPFEKAHQRNKPLELLVVLYTK